MSLLILLGAVNGTKVHTLIMVINKRNARQMGGPVSVSYTHLDVYKRQVQGRWIASLMTANRRTIEQYDVYTQNENCVACKTYDQASWLMPSHCLCKLYGKFVHIERFYNYEK